MKKFEYEITKHPADEFSQLAFFCTDRGECALSELPSDQVGVLGTLLNEKGAQGWELIQLVFGKDGVVAFWKKEI